MLVICVGKWIIQSRVFLVLWFLIVNYLYEQKLIKSANQADFDVWYYGPLLYSIMFPIATYSMGPYSSTATGNKIL